MAKSIIIHSILLAILGVAVVSVPSLPAAGESFPFLGEIQKDNVNVRAGQSQGFEKLGQLNTGEQVVVLGRDYSWYQIRLPEQCACYISANFVTMLGEGLGKVSGNRVNIRARPNLKSVIIGQANKNDLLRVLESKDGWYKIAPSGDLHGWVVADFITFKSKDVPPSRQVELPSRQNYPRPQRSLAKKIEPAPAPEVPKAEAERLKVSGVILDLGERSIAKNIRHRLMVDEDTGYYLQGHHWLLNGFLNQRVQIEGKIQSHITAPYPVVQVTKINLIL
jgi:SH3-like domain-containing protein